MQIQSPRGWGFESSPKTLHYNYWNWRKEISKRLTMVGDFECGDDEFRYWLWSFLLARLETFSDSLILLLLKILCVGLMCGWESVRLGKMMKLISTVRDSNVEALQLWWWEYSEGEGERLKIMRVFQGVQRCFQNRRGEVIYMLYVQIGLLWSQVWIKLRS